jgi:hypothetical protein
MSEELAPIPGVDFELLDMESPEVLSSLSKSMTLNGKPVIYSFEWRNKREQCTGVVLSKKGVFQRRIGARECCVREVPKSSAHSFLDSYHIQGANPLGIVFYGAFLGEELLGVLSLGRHTRNLIENPIVLDRLCFKKGVQIVGGASKLLKPAIAWARERGFKEIISFSENRLSKGGVYLGMGFALGKELGSDYFYVKDGERISKQSQKKCNSGCPQGMTEFEWSKHQGLVRVFDAGKKRWVLKLEGVLPVSAPKASKSAQKVARRKARKRCRVSEKVEVLCKYCQVTHTVRKLSHDKNIARNGRYICEREGGHIAGSRPKDHLKATNPYAAEGKKKCSRCEEVKVIELFDVRKKSWDGRDAACKACVSKKNAEGYQMKKAAKAKTEAIVPNPASTLAAQMAADSEFVAKTEEGYRAIDEGRFSTLEEIKARLGD